MTAAAPTKTSGPTTVAPQFPAGIALVGSQMRSTNLERDVSDALHSPYIGARTIDVLERITSAVADLRRTRTWSFTGPYGSGKSTLSNLIDALLGHDTARRNEAIHLLSSTTPALAQRLTAAREQRTSGGFIGAVATARREPLATTLVRSLETGATRRWGKRTPKAVATALAACKDSASTQHIIAALTAMTTNEPLLLIIDEFGKTLEHVASYRDFANPDHDLFLLQEIAEHCAGTGGLPVFMLTLQHLSFLDYASRSSSLESREWAKIQGRFEDVTFVPHHGDAMQLLRRRLDHSGVTPAGKTLIQAYADAAARDWKEHGLNVLAELSGDDLAHLYPLHPLTAIAAPLLAAQIGQHDRSLSSFLGSGEPNTVRDSLDTYSTGRLKHASTVRLPQLYDFFLNSGRTSLTASANASRWIEIDGRIREANGLPEHDQNLLKAIGVLNLIDADGALSATAEMIHFALRDPHNKFTPAGFTAVEEQLADLVRRGFLVHREFSGEYRLWQGTDVDIDARLDEIIGHLDNTYVVQRLGDYIPTTVVAGRHSQVTGMMRVFLTDVSGADTKRLAAPDEMTGPADGLVIFHLGTADKLPTVDSALPVILATTTNPGTILSAATHLIALKELQQDSGLDHVALREVTDRVVEAEATFRELFQAAFYPPSAEASWNLWHAGLTANCAPDATNLQARSLSALASRACDDVYPHTPHIRNEMLGRHALTSQAARARSDVLDAMLTHSGERFLGFPADKYGPERAIYSGVLAYMGLHRQNGAVQAEKTSDSLFPYGFSVPGDQDGAQYAQPVWEALQQTLTDATDRTSLEDVIRVLMSPPFGVKAGVWPLLVVTALLIRRHDVALFEEGTYLPRLTSEIVERLEKAPYRFEVKYSSVSTGQRAGVVKKLLVSLQGETPRSQALRNPDMLSVTRALIERVLVLSKYARKTTQISADALAVRKVLSEAQDPDDLLFHALPKALGLPAIGATARANTAAADEYVTRLTAAVDEISSIHTSLRATVIETLAREFRLPAELGELRATLATRLRGFADALLSSELRGFVGFAINDSLSDEDWLDPIIVRLTGSALGDWSDRDAAAFPRRAADMAAALDRVSHLHHSSSDAADGEQDLHTQLLTLTDKSGAEQRTLIYIPEGSRAKANTLADDVLKKAEKALGPDGARILLAALAQRVTDTAAEPQTKEQQ